MLTDDASGSGELPSSGNNESLDFAATKLKAENDDKCEPNPCQNGGTCTSDYNLIDGFKCECAKDFGGITCGGTSALYTYQPYVRIKKNLTTHLVLKLLMGSFQHGRRF